MWGGIGVGKKLRDHVLSKILGATPSRASKKRPGVGVKEKQAKKQNSWSPSVEFSPNQPATVYFLFSSLYLMLGVRS